jgi:endonuclease-3
VTPDLFARYGTAEEYANADAEELERAIRATGFYRNKTKSIRKACAQLVEQHDGKVPQSMDELVALPGVARKTAAVVLGNAFGINAGIPVDTHVRRLAMRMKLTHRKKSQTDKIEQDLMALVAQRDWTTFAHLLTWHGRRTCTARKPDCDDCVVNDLCPSAFKV